MNNRSIDYMRYFFLCFIVAAPLISSSAEADETLRKALAKAQFMLRQANAENAKLKQDLNATNTEVESLRENLEKELAKAEKKEGKLKKSLSSWKESHENMKLKLIQTTEELFAANSSIQELTQKLSTQTENFELCYKDNNKLSQINTELLGLYENKSVWDAITQREPFVQKKQVDVENLIQKYRFQIEDVDLGMNEHMIKKVN